MSRGELSETRLTIDGALARPPLRFRRFGGGYKREDVELVLAEVRLMLRSLELELQTLRERSRDLESQLRESRLELDGFRAKGFELARAMTNARARSEEIERDAQTRAAEILAEAEEAAARRHAEIDAEVAARQAELDDVARAREELLASVRGVVRDLDETLERVDQFEAQAEPETEPEPEPEPELDRVPEELPPDLPPVVAFAVHGNGAPATEPGPADDSLFAERVELDAGPFADFDSIAAFERELARLPNVDDVYVRRVDGERAVIELTLTSIAPLVAEMREHLPYALSVRGGDDAHLVMDVAGAA